MADPLGSLEGRTVGEGRFRLESALGKGGFGAVYTGVEVQTGRPVAVKVLHALLADDEVHLARFRREAEVTARLAHPHVVEVLATGGGAGGVAPEPPFIAMEHLGGGSLSARLKAGETFDTTRVVQIGRQILSAVEAAHSIGVIHRDLKPANIMLVDGPSGGTVKVVDFGIARLATTEAITRLTKTGHVVGTPTYMAPEQAMGVPATPATDVYAAAAILHRLLTGMPPYGRGNYADLLMRMVGDERKRMTGFGRLGEVIERGLAHDVYGRYATAREFADALAGHDPTPTTTVLAWRPPENLADLRLPPAPEGALRGADALTAAARRTAPQARPPAPSKTAPSTEATTEAGHRWSAPVTVAAIVLAALGIGAIGTYLALRGNAPTHAANPSAAVPPVAPPAPVALVPAVAPVALGERMRDAASETNTRDRAEDTEEQRPRTQSAMAHRGRARRAVSVQLSGGEFPRGTSETLRPQLRALDAALTSCWPIADPAPPDNRGAFFTLQLDAQGVVRGAAPVTNLYPEFNACARQVFMGRHFDLPAAEPLEIGASYVLHATRLH
ncbi:MAG: serine/threonine protein kinase [Deltaproteobacteria bacterium]|nr:serine/threonine protein kinase [Deltaproteobacteria bacterium]